MPSSVIRSFFYDVNKATLTIIFVSGLRYVYEGVPQEVYRALAEAPSKREYFNAHIRDHFPFRRFGKAG